MGKKIKHGLGTGTRTHACPFILDYGTDTSSGFRKAGGILVVIGPDREKKITIIRITHSKTRCITRLGLNTHGIYTDWTIVGSEHGRGAERLSRC